MKTTLELLASLSLCSLTVACGDDTTAADTDAESSSSDATSTDPSAPSTGPAPSSSEGTRTGEATTEETGHGADSSSDGGETGPVDEDAPVLAITAPRPGAAISSRWWTFEGTVEDEGSGLTSLSYAGPDGDVEVDVADDGSFAVRVMLEPGEHAYAFTAEDAAGNTAEVATPVHFGHRASVGNSQAAFLRDGVLWTWGRNELGQLGNGTLAGSGWGDDPKTAELPVRYEVEVDDLVSIVTRQTFMLGLQSDGTVLSWGDNEAGQLGRSTPADCGSSGTTPCGRTPAAVDGLDHAVAIGAGFDHAIVLRDDGSVWTFGDNTYGQLGADTAGEPRMAPAAVAGLSDIIQVAAGSDVSYALGEDGTVYAWGENDSGQLGRGSVDDDAHPSPQAIMGLAGVVHVAAANTTAYALLADGTVVTWGRNHAGQAGIGVESEDDVLTPTAVVVEDGTTLDSVVSVSGDGFVGLALTADGQVYAFGLGALGQLGQGFLEAGERDLEDRRHASPVAVDRDDMDVFDILEVEGGAGGPSLAVSTDGHLFGWGWSFRGSLGLEGAINAWAYSAPVLVFAAD